MKTFAILGQDAYIDGEKIDCVVRIQIDLHPNLNTSLVTLTTSTGVISENVDSKILVDYDTSSFKRRRDWAKERAEERAKA